MPFCIAVVAKLSVVEVAPARLLNEVPPLVLTCHCTVGVGDPQQPDVLCGPVISARQRERVTGYIEKGIAEGAELLAAGEPAKVVSSKRAGQGRLVVKLDRRVGRGAALEVPREAPPEPEAGKWYVFQRVGRPFLLEKREAQAYSSAPMVGVHLQRLGAVTFRRVKVTEIAKRCPKTVMGFRQQRLQR